MFDYSLINKQNYKTKVKYKLRHIHGKGSSSSTPSFDTGCTQEKVNTGPITEPWGTSLNTFTFYNKSANAYYYY